jgi:hypothetical protein
MMSKSWSIIQYDRDLEYARGDDRYIILVRQFEDHFRGLGVDGRIILRGILKKMSVRTWTELN